MNKSDKILKLMANREPRKVKTVFIKKFIIHLLSGCVGGRSQRSSPGYASVDYNIINFIGADRLKVNGRSNLFW